MQNEYQRKALVEMNNGEIQGKFCVKAQLDTASPISLIKTKFVPFGLVSEIKKECFEGINGSVLKLVDMSIAKISFEQVIGDKVELRVVPESTMRCDLSLGRDAMKVLGLEVIKRSAKMEPEVFMGEIMNIETSVFDGNEIDKLDVNPNLIYEMQNRLRKNFLDKYVCAQSQNYRKLRLS